MIFNSHSAVAGKHAILSPSNYHWIRYNDQKLAARYATIRASVRGTALHELAHTAIKLGVKLAKSNPTLSMYVNDAIGYKMETEQTLYYSDNCFGTADTISFRRGTLRIHDLKTGVTPSSFQQLEVYAAIFCLEYGYNPFDIRIELRIYQNSQCMVQDGDPEVIGHIMDRIVELDFKIDQLREDEGG